MVKRIPKRRKKRVSNKTRRIEVHYGNVTHLFQAEGFNVSDDGILTISENGEVIYANKNAWIYVMDLDRVTLLQPIQQTEVVPTTQTEEAPGPSSVMPGLEPSA